MTVSRAGHRWYASVLCKVTTDLPEKPTRRQQARGTLGVGLGVKHIAALSQPLTPDDRSAGDGRGRVVALTPAGRELIYQAFTEHMRNERRLLDALPPRRRHSWKHS